MNLDRRVLNSTVSGQYHAERYVILRVSVIYCHHVIPLTADPDKLCPPVWILLTYIFANVQNDEVHLFIKKTTQILCYVKKKDTNCFFIKYTCCWTKEVAQLYSNYALFTPPPRGLSVCRQAFSWH